MRLFSKSSAISSIFSGIVLLHGPILHTAIAQDFPKDEAGLYEAAKKEGTVVWYESAPLQQATKLALEFEKQYPGVKVEILRIPGVQQYQRFMEEVQSGQHKVDILHISDQPSLKSLIADGHVAEWKVPEYDRMPAAFRLGSSAYSNYTTSNAIVYNVNKVTPEEVAILEASWTGVLDPRFKGRFAVSSMKCGACYVPIHMFLDPALKDTYGEDFLKKVAAQKPAIYADVLVGLDRVIAGENDFTYWTWEGVALSKAQQGAPIRWIFPRPTPTWGNSWQGISKYAPHPNAARLFQNWSMSEPGAMALQAIFGAPTAITGVPDQRPVTKEAWYKPVAEVYNVDFDRWDKNYHHDMDTWIGILKDAK
jgi:ABC-type Fe3+ transport system substrate-binding protein